jgi:hypothetical protein
VNQQELKHKFVPDASIKDHVLHALECKGTCASIWIRRHLHALGVSYDQTQTSDALQRLKAEGLVSYNAAWELAGNALAGSTRDRARALPAS